MNRQLGLALMACGIATSCRPSVEAPSSPAPSELGTDHIVAADEVSSPSSTAASDRRRRYQMRQQLEDLHDLEDLLVAGRLDEASPLVAMLEPPHGTARGTALSGEASRGAPMQAIAPGASDAAHAMAHATTIEQACQIAARVTAACGDCHERSGARVSFAAEPEPPVGAQDRCSPRHRWALGRLADGVTGGLDAPWRAGLDTFVVTPLTGPGVPAAHRVQALARESLASFAFDTVDSRATTYGLLLATCAGCHAAARARR
jgi:hypothetical protein